MPRPGAGRRRGPRRPARTPARRARPPRHQASADPEGRTEKCQPERGRRLSPGPVARVAPPARGRRAGPGSPRTARARRGAVDDDRCRAPASQASRAPPGAVRRGRRTRRWARSGRERTSALPGTVGWERERGPEPVRSWTYVLGRADYHAPARAHRPVLGVPRRVADGLISSRVVSSPVLRAPRGFSVRRSRGARLPPRAPLPAREPRRARRRASRRGHASLGRLRRRCRPRSRRSSCCGLAARPGPHALRRLVLPLRLPLLPAPRARPSSCW